MVLTVWVLIEHTGSIANKVKHNIVMNVRINANALFGVPIGMRWVQSDIMFPDIQPLVMAFVGAQAIKVTKSSIPMFSFKTALA